MIITANKIPVKESKKKETKTKTKKPAKK